ncbi:MAG: 1-deoxy-D-xylulose-5-phosphate reductoisomerase [Deltaproteobacteria bacterium]|nr:MAG: 1-deoxy-D-xylulose-5-phosphate reductoisomerase [Deltaproteobacteria bacterium]
MKKIAILGSTGSIGLNALEVIARSPEHYSAIALTAGRNVELLKTQIEKFRPVGVAVLEEDLAEILRARLDKTYPTEVLSGTEGFVHLATLPEVDTVVSAMTGAAGLVPTYAAVEAGKDIALANKETLVMAGPLIMDAAKRHKITILPIDSEHSAILQSLQGHPREDVRRIILTASGGPFRNFPFGDMEKVTPGQALNHPTWNMGKKISIDSATLMNKGLEAIEAKWFFDLRMDQISIVIHPQSIIHSMVEYRDGSIIAQMGIPHMITPISYALSYPRHIENHLVPLQLDEIEPLTFQKPDLKKFPCLDLALEAGEIGQSMPAVMNGANEIAVDAFLNDKIGFLQIPMLIRRTMEAHRTSPIDSIEKVMETDSWARDTAREQLRAITGE